jgi:AcrR family transcriptional regulator
MYTSRRPQGHGNLANDLRAATRAILDEACPEAVGLREAARRVGVSATAAYRHFANKEELLASVAAEGFRELAAAMERGATGSDPLGRVGLAYLDFASQKRGLFRLMFGPILVERAKYPELNEAASAVFGLLQRITVRADEWPHEDNVAGVAAWGLVMALFAHSERPDSTSSRHSGSWRSRSGEWPLFAVRPWTTIAVPRKRMTALRRSRKLRFELRSG